MIKADHIEITASLKLENFFTKSELEFLKDSTRQTLELENDVLSQAREPYELDKETKAWLKESAETANMCSCLIKKLDSLLKLQ